jgi:hypothetical protein
MKILRPAAIVALVVPLMLIAACSTPDTPEVTPTTPPPVTTAPSSPAPTPSGGGAGANPDEPTCETIIPAATVADFEEAGWTVQADVFRIGGLEIADGIECTWGDFSVATDHVQIYGWAPIDRPQADAAQAELLRSGWRREEGEGGFYITESTETAIAPDEDGYGLTYFFGDGWVTLADTKQTLVLVEWPIG